MLTVFLVIMNIIAAVASYLMFAFVSYKAYHWFMPYVMKDFYHLTYVNVISLMMIIGIFILPALSRLVVNLEDIKKFVNHEQDLSDGYFIKSIIVNLIAPIFAFIFVYAISWLFYWFIAPVA